MKKMKKLLTGLLALVMAITTVAIQTPITAKAAQTTTPATIDTTQTGSLTIHKYAYDGADGITGTGSESDTVPTGAQALVGAGFTLYKVVDVDGLDTYYGTNATALPDVEYFFVNEDFDDGIDSSKVLETIAEQQTGSNGTTTFSGLALGIYVVVETTTPDSVSQAMDPFIVSIPMTTVGGASWLYDVHVFPKNQTTYGGVILEKTDHDNTDTKLGGVTFVLQKKTETEVDGETVVSWTNITNQSGPAGDNTGTALNLVTATTKDETNGIDVGQIKVEGLSQGTYRFIETSVGTDNKGYIMDGATTFEFVVNSDGTITYNNGTTANVTISVTNDKPDFTKEVEDREDSDWGQESDYSVGDLINYQLTIEVPSNITSLKTFTVTDTPTNLKDIIFNDDGDSIVVLTYGDTKSDAMGDSKGTIANSADKTIYVVERNGENGFKITFTPENMTDYAGKVIVISYQAELLDSAVVTTDGNPNTATLEYSNNILPEVDEDGNPTDPDNPNNDLEEDTAVIEDNAIIYTFEIDIVKKALNANGDPLEGVEFDLYKEVAADDVIDADGDGNISDAERTAAGVITDAEATAAGLDIGTSSAKRYWTKINSNSLVTDENGKITYPGLAKGTYYLVETKTADRYNLLKDPVQVTLNIAYTTVMTESWSWTIVDGVETLTKHEITSTTFTNTDDTDTTDGTSGIELQTIINQTGFTLPTTGGVGTYIFVFVGVSMMAAAVILFFTTKKKEVK